MRIESFFNKLGKVIPWTLVVVLAIICGKLLYGAVDQAVTFDHRNQQCLLLQEQRDVLRHITDSVAKGITKAEFVELLAQHGVKSFYNGNDQIVAGQVGFYFENNSLTRIEAEDLGAVK